MKGILGKKVGMTEVFTKSGKLIPVTVIQVEPNVVTQVKTVESDGYNAIQVGVFDKKEKNATKAELGHTKKANTAPKRFLKEIKNVEATYNLGDKISADIFAAGEVVDVTGTSKGKGFQGPIKRHGQSRGPETHGSRYHRRVGSMGTLRPMRVMKGKKLPGHMGHETITIQNLEIIDINLAENYILVSGNVPGAKNSYVFIKSAVKNPKARKAEELVSSMETVIDEVVETTEEVSAPEVTETEAVEVSEEALEETVETPAEEVSEEAVEETVVESEGSIEETKEPETEVTE